MHTLISLIPKYSEGMQYLRVLEEWKFQGEEDAAKTINGLVSGANCTKNIPPLIHISSLADSNDHRDKETPSSSRGIKVMKISHKLSTKIEVAQRTSLVQDAPCLKENRWKARCTGPRGMLHTM